MRGRRATRRRLLARSGTVLAAAVAGCHDPDDPGDLGEPEPRVDVEARSTAHGGRFAQPVVHLVEEGTIQWRASGDHHDVTAYHPEMRGLQRRIPASADPWASATIPDGDAFQRTFEHEGVYNYVCTRNEDDGMCGAFVVGWPHPDEEPALHPVSDDYPAEVRRSLERYTQQIREFLEKVHEG